MPVLFNKESGLAEDLPKDAEQAALASGSHEIPLISPQGEMGSVTSQDAADMLHEGYRQPNAQELKSMLKEAKFGTAEQQLKTGLEGAASAATFGLSTDVEQMLGVEPEAIVARREVNPNAHALGEAAGVLGTTALGVGEGALLTKAASLVPKLGESFVARVAQIASKGAIQNALFQAGDETSKMLSQDPHQSAETALVNVGMSGLLGAGLAGGLGTVSEGWQGLVGSKASKFVKDFADRGREHLGIVTEPESIMSPYKSDIFGAGAKQPAIENIPATTPGAKAMDMLVKDGLDKYIGGAIGAGAGKAVGHPVLGYLFGEKHIAPIIKKVLPALVRPILETEGSAAGFKAAMDYSLAAVKGEMLLNKATGAIFSESDAIVKDTSDKDISKLEDRLLDIANDPTQLLNVGGQTGHYMPQHSQAMAELATRNVQYLQSLKPDDTPKAPLDSHRELNSVEAANYKDALIIAQNPLSITKSIKQGTLTPADVMHLKKMYPGLYQQLNQKIMEHLIDKKTDRAMIPYRTKLSISAFLGQPLDSSMLPGAIIASQPPPMQPMAQPKSEQPKTRENSHLVDIAKSSATPSERTAMHRMK